MLAKSITRIVKAEAESKSILDDCAAVMWDRKLNLLMQTVDTLALDVAKLKDKAVRVDLSLDRSLDDITHRVRV